MIATILFLFYLFIINKDEQKIPVPVPPSPAIESNTPQPIAGTLRVPAIYISYFSCYYDANLATANSTI
jgi:hypothetical protein